ncbi:hypothetical protein EMIHUDRAFT_238536 [Emiliania huxleyi CCMP1516]|uniref:Uncharacterized protein n=2 Tax=Emiliania huxleyi TaxID=2903 RepID=A0A0D3JLL7_EMIH1|nr:hypothetical protein EMIHUDRAFT_238536 [Emiliania huxleyi CCMP1516]EOD24402.1 hypothetical protein EMIHUDRAFT_238536 [Emiliania huxleyi CCMP1516]|eukprot:XP_005776831.1 hypothetical protein EMIHUDRAFT_238536 [Emiliania huxleyi CCMP1516]
MGCGESKPDELEEEQREQLAQERQLMPEKQPVGKLDLDRRCRGLCCRQTKAEDEHLLRTEFLRADGSEAVLPKLLRRQELERMEEERRIRIFLTPKEAVAALRSLSREVAGLTYGWATPDHPDVTGEYLANVRRFLRHPLGEHVIEIDGEGPRVAEMEDRADEGVGPRNKRVIAAIHEAAFTGKGATSCLLPRI